MSCQLNLHSGFEDIRAVRKYLLPQFKDDDKNEETDSEAPWVDGWDWQTDESKGSKGQNESLMSWFQDCIISISPTSDYMAIAKDDRLVILSQKWNSKQEHVQSNYCVLYEGTLKQDDGGIITSVLCLPLASHKRSTQGGPDWTCILVGFSTGYVRMYTEQGSLLLSQIFSEEPVTKIKCKTYEPPRHATEAEKHEELTILYRKSLVTIDGFSLFQSLRACRNQVARATASGSDPIQPPPLAYKKWALQDQNQIDDQVPCGLVSPNPFDQMKTASMIGGYGATIKSTSPASHIYLTAGMGPYTGFFYAVEGSTQPMLSDVAHAVASKLKSALFSQLSAASGWLGIGKNNQDNHKENKKPKIEPATSLPLRFGLFDKRRHGESLVLSPDNKLVATTDSYGRVILIDVMRGIAIRVWKGYRDAQVAWIEVKEDIQNEARDEHGRKPVARRALFLIIYAPRRGILEVWTAQHGPRVAAFNVNKWCRMLCPGYGLMGLNNVTCKDVKVQIHQCFLIDPEGHVKTIEIPFHLALSDKNSRRARESHLLKKLKTSLKENTVECSELQTEVIETLLDMKIGSIRQQALERVLHTKYLSADFLLAIIKAVTHQLEVQVLEVEQSMTESTASDVLSDGLDYESRILVQFCKAQERLIETYLALKSINDKHRNKAKDEVVDEALCKLFSISLDEFQSLKENLHKYQEASQTNISTVQFEEDTLEMSVVDFLSCFQCQHQREEGQDVHISKIDDQLLITVPVALSETKRGRLANFMFKLTLDGGAIEQNDLQQCLEQSPIPPDLLMNLLMYLWLSNDKGELKKSVHLHYVMKSITSLHDHREIVTDHNIESPWWQSVRTLCSQSDNISSSLLAALVGRSVAMEMGENGKNGDTLSVNSTDLGDWESVTMDRTQWTVLVKQLEDLLVLQCLLKMKPCNDTKSGSQSKDSNAIGVSVRKVLEGGRGVLPELVAKWISGNEILPSMLCISQDEENETTEDGKDTSEKVKVGSGNPITSQIQTVQKRLPLSLDSDILMANCAWEYIVLWNKSGEEFYTDLSHMTPLEQALSYVRCIQNAVLQHGVAIMMWHMHFVKIVSAAGLLMEKIKKIPNERLCRKHFRMVEACIDKFMDIAIQLLETIMEASQDAMDPPVFNVEDLWQHVQGPTSLVELAIEQKKTHYDLVDRHHCLCIVLHAILNLSMKSIKPLSLFDRLDRDAFFKSLQSSIPLSSKVTDESIISSRKEFLCKIITLSVISLSATPEKPSTPDSSDSQPSSPKSSAPPTPPASPMKNKLYSKWSTMVYTLAKCLSVDQDELRRHHVCELYSSGLDKMAEEVLLAVNVHALVGSLLLSIVGQRLAHYIFISDPQKSVERLSNCSPSVSAWLKTMDSTKLRCPNPPLKDTATLVGHAVNQLTEGHQEYNLAISLVELVQSLL